MMKTQNRSIGLFLLLTLLMGLAVPAWAAPAAATYYVSNSGGSDSNDGLSETKPFQTIDKVNSLALQPGDRVLFKCGDTWRGEMLTITQSGAAGQPITFGSFPAGCANQPVISGAQPISGWTHDSGNIYRADLGSGANAGRFTNGINQLFRSGERLRLGRWPNLDAPDGGFSTIDGHPSERQINDNELPAGDWSGAVLHMKSIRWAILNREVTGGSGTTLIVGSAAQPGTRLDCWADNGDCTGWGYFLTNHHTTLDQDGEWAYNAGTVYLYSTSGAPADGAIEASAILVNPTDLQRSWGGVNLGADYGVPLAYVTFENLHIQGWFRHGIAAPTNLHPSENHDLVLRNNTIRDVDGIGINLATWGWDAADGRPDGWRGGYNLVVSGNTIQRANQMGINLYARNSEFSRNTLGDIARIENLGAAGMGCGFDDCDASGGACTEDGDGIRIKIDRPADTGNNNTFSGNRLERIGYNGFDVFGYANTFEHNVIIQACLSKGDCGGVRTFGRDNLSASPVYDLAFNTNIITGTLGNTDGCRDDFDPLFGFGFYIDNYSRNITLNGNTVAGSTAHGILFQNSTGVAANNSLYNNGDNGDYSAGQLYITNNAGDPALLSSSTGNIFFALRANARTLATGSPARLGASDHNYFFHPYRAGHIYAGREYNLAGWQAASGKDSHSKEHWYTQPAGEEPRSRIFYNDTAQTRLIDLGNAIYTNLDQNPVFGSLSLAPYTSRILIETEAANLAVSMALAGSSETAPGAPVTYTITIANRGNLPASNVDLTNNLPEQIIDTHWSASPGTAILQSGTRYVWQIASLPVNGAYVFTVGGKYAGSLTPGASLLVTTTAAAASPEVAPGNNSASLFLGTWRRVYLPLVQR